MADHTSEPDRYQVPDYELPDELELHDPAQYGALFNDTRQQIISVLSERAATTSELAEVLGKPKGTVGHHAKVLEDAGLIHVVATKRVRALEARYYGRTARTFLYHHQGEAVGEAQRTVARAAAAMSRLPERPDDAGPTMANSRDVRIPAERAGEWIRRLDDLIDEFGREPRGGDTTFSLLVALYPTDRPALPHPSDPEVHP